MDFKNIIIYTDMDGTVLTDWDLGPVVPQRSLAAIKRFMDKGGTFSIASGRQYMEILPFLKDCIPNAPVVQGNGTSLYDCIEKKVINKLPLSRKYKEECIEFCRERPWIWVCCGSADTVMQLQFGDSRDKIRKAFTEYRVDLNSFLENEFTKLVYVVEDPALIAKVREGTDHFETANEMMQTLSAPIFLECYSKEAGKANGIRKAMELAGMTDKTLVCIGDYYNDEAMLRIADIAACPDNAPDDLKALCQIVTCNNNEGALADLIDTLEKM